jgi:hypothetical protein
MDWILGHTGLVAGALVYVLWEFWLGKTTILKPNSTVELVLEVVYKVIGNLLGKAAAQAAAAEPFQLPDAEKAAGRK